MPEAALSPAPEPVPTQGQRNLSRRFHLLASGAAILLTLVSLISLTLSPLDPMFLRSSHLFLASVIAFSLRAAGSPAPTRRITIPDLAWMVGSAAVWAYLAVEAPRMVYRSGTDPTTLDVVFGGIASLVVLEMARRLTGLSLPILVLALFAYTLWGNHLPGLLEHKGYSLSTTISMLFSMLGLYGVPIGISATIALMFIMFGVFLEFVGGSKFFVDLAQGMAGHLRAGPAKIAIVASSLFGTISGSAVSNVLVTGTFTIPMMRNVGFRPVFASAVEAVASTGGQIMPPVMGAAAFVMAEMTGVPYSKVITTAIVPAVLFYVALFWMADLEAQKMGMQARLDRSQLPRVGAVLRRDWMLVVPLAVLVWTLAVLRFSANRSALFAVLALVLISWVRPSERMNFRRILSALDKTGRAVLDVAATCAAAGMAIGLISTTGLGLRLGSALLTFSEGNVALALVLTMLLCLVLGMGMPTVAAYAVAQAVAVPVLVDIGVNVYVANFFVFYFACVSAITPPVALAAYAAAGLSGANPMQVGFTAAKLGAAGLIVPFMFAYSPELLLIQGTVPEMALAAISATIGALALGSALQGWALLRANLLERGLFLAAALLLIKPGLTTDLAGLALLAAGLLAQWQRQRKGEATRKVELSMPSSEI